MNETEQIFIPPKFKKSTVFGSGYSQEAVDTYLKEMFDDHNAAMAELRTAITEKEETIESMKEAAASVDAIKEKYEREIEALNNEITDRDDKIQDLILKTNGLEAELHAKSDDLAYCKDQMDDQLAAKNDAISRLSEENNRLKDRNAALNQKSRDVTTREEEAIKATENYNVITAQIGKIRLDAHAEALNIKNAARNDAQEMIENAKKEADNILSDARNKADDMIRKANELRTEIEEDGQQMQDAVDSLSMKLYEDFQRIKCSIETMKSHAGLKADELSTVNSNEIEQAVTDNFSEAAKASEQAFDNTIAWIDQGAENDTDAKVLMEQDYFPAISGQEMDPVEDQTDEPDYQDDALTARELQDSDIEANVSEILPGSGAETPSMQEEIFIRPDYPEKGETEPKPRISRSRRRHNNYARKTREPAE